MVLAVALNAVTVVFKESRRSCNPPWNPRNLWPPPCPRPPLLPGWKRPSRQGPTCSHFSMALDLGCRMSSGFIYNSENGLMRSRPNIYICLSRSTHNGRFRISIIKLHLRDGQCNELGPQAVSVENLCVAFLGFGPGQVLHALRLCREKLIITS